MFKKPFPHVTQSEERDTNTSVIDLQQATNSWCENLFFERPDMHKRYSLYQELHENKMYYLSLQLYISSNSIWSFHVIHKKGLVLKMFTFVQEKSFLYNLAHQMQKRTTTCIHTPKLNALNNNNLQITAIAQYFRKPQTKIYVYRILRFWKIN